jgi:hypothetical protein
VPGRVVDTCHVFLDRTPSSTAALAIQGVRRSQLRGLLLGLGVAIPLIAAGFGVGDFVRAGRADKVIRAAVLEAARENGIEDAAGRLSRPVIKAEAGLWVVIAAGVGAAVLGRIGAAEE